MLVVLCVFSFDIWKPWAEPDHNCAQKKNRFWASKPPQKYIQWTDRYKCCLDIYRRQTPHLRHSNLMDPKMIGALLDSSAHCGECFAT